MKTYAHLNAYSDVSAYKSVDNVEEYTIMVASVDVDGCDIKYKHAGQLLRFPTVKDLRDKLLELRSLGYLINQNEIMDMNKEIDKP